jgi:hypothetical protein
MSDSPFTGSGSFYVDRILGFLLFLALAWYVLLQPPSSG